MIINNTYFQTYSDYATHIVAAYRCFPHEFDIFLEDSSNLEALYKMIFLDVDSVIPLIADFYSSQGRPATNQIPILRSLVLMNHFRCYSLTNWTRMLRNNRRLAIISGFFPDSIPNFSSYYDFFNRLYLGAKHSRKDYILDHKPYESPKKDDLPKKKGEKWVNHDERATVKLYETLKEKIDHTKNLDEKVLLQLFDALGVSFSIDHGLLDGHCIINGDGTCFHSHASPKGISVDENNDKIRRYSDLDANWGYDSDIEKSYFGYTIYTICNANHNTGNDLPVFLGLEKASQHDAITSMTALAQLCSINKRLTFTHYCLDSASDNVSTHKLIMSYDILPLVDINKRNAGKNIYENFDHISENGRPVCPAGYECVKDGYDKSRFRLKFICPFAKRKENPCAKKDECSKSKCGRTYYIKTSDDIRLFGVIQYKSEQWKQIYKDRTSCERMNNRILNDYNFKDNRMRGRNHNFFMLTMTGINIHLDAYLKKISTKIVSHDDKSK